MMRKIQQAFPEAQAEEKINISSFWDAPLEIDSTFLSNEDDHFVQVLGDTPEKPFSFNPQSMNQSSGQDYSSSYSEEQDSQSSLQQEQPIEQKNFMTVKKRLEPNQSKIELKTPSTARTIIERCNCDKTNCAKAYCVCFKNGRVCSEHCKCSDDCQNHEITSVHLKKIKLSLEYFSTQKFEGCTCKKSKCLKKYCICHSNGRKCSKACNCLQCHNSEQKEEQINDFQHLSTNSINETPMKKVKIYE